MKKTKLYPNGAKYVGEYKDGKRNGKGIHSNEDGTIFHSGLWKDDEPVK